MSLLVPVRYLETLTDSKKAPRARASGGACAGDKNPIFGIRKTLSDKTKELIKQRALGRTLSEETRALLSIKHGNPVNLYEKNYDGKFSLIGSFVSIRKAAKFLDISAGTVTRYMQSGKLFKDKYKFSTR
jgi:hypothetical protein